MTTILRVVVAVIAATLFFTWVAPALAQQGAVALEALHIAGRP